jgi:hypothetical protein
MQYPRGSQFPVLHYSPNKDSATWNQFQNVKIKISCFSNVYRQEKYVSVMKEDGRFTKGKQ